jgi:hypothetical protein
LDHPSLGGVWQLSNLEHWPCPNAHQDIKLLALVSSSNGTNNLELQFTVSTCDKSNNNY